MGPPKRVPTTRQRTERCYLHRVKPKNRSPFLFCRIPSWKEMKLLTLAFRTPREPLLEAPPRRRSRFWTMTGFRPAAMANAQDLKPVAAVRRIVMHVRRRPRRICAATVNAQEPKRAPAAREIAASVRRLHLWPSYNLIRRATRWTKRLVRP